MDDFRDRYRAAVEACTEIVLWQPRQTPAEAFEALAKAAAEMGGEWDSYGERGVVAVLEHEVAELLGKPAGVFFPSGVMGQQAALRVWCERRGSLRVAIPDLSHLLLYEDDGPRVLHGLRVEHLTQGRRVATAGDLRGLPAGLGACLVELPLRDAGCLLPTWEELSELSAAARELGVPLHVDGARLWESQPYYDRPLAEIAALTDSIYVSFYKGLAAFSGAMVLAEADVAKELRLWRHRLGGTLYRLTPYALSALVGLRELQPRMGEYAAWARAFAVALVEQGLRVTPDPPHTNTFLVYADGDEDRVNERLLELLTERQVDFSPPWRAADAPGVVTTEVTVYSPALGHDPVEVAGWYAELISSAAPSG